MVTLERQTSLSVSVTHRLFFAPKLLIAEGKKMAGTIISKILNSVTIFEIVGLKI